MAIIVSMNIKPYAEAVEGINESLGKEKIGTQIFFLEAFTGKAQIQLKEKLLREEFALFIAVGPEAAGFVWSDLPEKKERLVYTMILNPEHLKDSPQVLCGVSLSIPPEQQILKISKVFPHIKRIGLLYDPQYNADFYHLAIRKAVDMGLSVVSLEVPSRKDLPRILEDNWDKVDCLWMIPDRTLISESLIQYIIKEALLKRKPVVGFNRFFMESGAVMNFIFDYRNLGRQAARLGLEILKGEPCSEKEPEFEIWLNDRILEKLGIGFSDKEKGVIKKAP